ncbi:MAG TPA: SUF system Fe-S cluster assembly protein [Terriglobia bacterium]|nr:SUF system Fe-S cluster assembly protein [Terriglobia bacterium]
MDENLENVKAENTSPADASGENPPLTVSEAIQLQDKVIEALRTCYDPEIPVNIYDLGLIYEVKVERTGDVYVRMTLTAPTCPVAGSLPPEVEQKVKELPGVTSAKIDLVWEPPWEMSKMSEAAKLQLGMW